MRASRSALSLLAVTALAASAFIACAGPSVASGSPRWSLFLQSGTAVGTADVDGVALNPLDFSKVTIGGGLAAYALSEASDGKLAAVEPPDDIGLHCTDVDFEYPRTGHGLRMADSDDVVFAKTPGAMSVDGKVYAFAAGTAVPSTDPDGQITCPTAATTLRLAPTSTAPTRDTVTIDPGLKPDTALSIKNDDRTVVVGVSRQHAGHALIVLDVTKAHLLSQGRVVTAGSCGLYSPAYLPSGVLAALRKCGASVSLVEFGHAGRATALATVPALGPMQASPDGRLMVQNGKKLYVLAANGKGGLHNTQISIRNYCRDGYDCSLTTFTW